MALVTRWDPLAALWREMSEFPRDVGRLLDRWHVAPVNWYRLSPAYPALNIWEDNDNVYAEAELPGLNLEDLEIVVTGADELTIKGERRAAEVPNAIWHRQERGFGKFTRVVQLPVPVDADKVEARLEHGVLTITMPKTEAARARRIVVKGE